MWPVALAAVALVGGVWLWATGSRRHTPRESATANDTDDEALDDLARATATVIVEENTWDACAFDGIEEDWRRFAGPSPRGFSGVPAGRHRLVAHAPEGEARIDFVVEPGAAIALRLDAAGCRWRALETAPPDVREGEWIVHKTVLGVARAKRGEKVIVPDAVVARVVLGIDELAARAEAKDDRDALRDDADALGEALVGVPLSLAQIRRIRSALASSKLPVPVCEAIFPD